MPTLQWILVACALALVQAGAAQDGDALQQQEAAHSNGWKPLAMEQLTHPITVVGFTHQQFENYKRKEHLHATFYTALPCTANIRAYATSTHEGAYGFESIPLDCTAGWNQINTDGIGEILGPANGASRKLHAVAVDSDQRLYPVQLLPKNTVPKSEKHYRMTVVPKLALSYYSYSLISTETKQVLYESGGTERAAAKPITFDIIAGLEMPAGEYSILFEYTQITGKSLEDRWYFTHQ